MVSQKNQTLDSFFYCSYLRFATGSSNTDIVVLLMLMFGMVDLWKSADIHK